MGRWMQFRAVWVKFTCGSIEWLWSPGFAAQRWTRDQKRLWRHRTHCDWEGGWQPQIQHRSVCTSVAQLKNSGKHVCFVYPSRACNKHSRDIPDSRACFFAKLYSILSPKNVAIIDLHISSHHLQIKLADATASAGFEEPYLIFFAPNNILFDQYLNRGIEEEVAQWAICIEAETLGESKKVMPPKLVCQVSRNTQLPDDGLYPMISTKCRYGDMFQGAWKCVYFCLDWLPWMNKTVGPYRIWDSQMKALWIQHVERLLFLLVRQITERWTVFVYEKWCSIPNWTEDSWANWTILWRSFDCPLGECDATHGSIQLGPFQCYRTGTFRGEPLVQCPSELSKVSHQSEYPNLPSSKFLRMTLVATPHKTDF